jgi:hypothetical protein
MNKSNIIGICVAATYFITYFIIHTVVGGWWPEMFAFFFALPFSAFSGQLPFMLHIPGPKGVFIVVIINTIWWYFIIKLIYYMINYIILKANSSDANDSSIILNFLRWIDKIGNPNIIGICAGIIYLIIALIIIYIIRGSLGSFLLATLSFPFSLPSFFICIFIDEPQTRIIYLILNAIWWYFFVRLIYLVKRKSTALPGRQQA